MRENEHQIEEGDTVKSVRTFQGRDFLGEGHVVLVTPVNYVVIWSKGTGNHSYEPKDGVTLLRKGANPYKATV